MSKQESLKNRLSKLTKKLVGAKPQMSKIIKSQINQIHSELEDLLAQSIPAHEFFQPKDSRLFGSGKSGIAKMQRESLEARYE